MFLVDLPDPAIQITGVPNTIDSSMPGSHAEITIDNLRVPADQMLGDAGEGFKYAQIRLRISEVLDTYFAKSRTSVSLSPGQLAQIGQECLVEFQAAMISAFSPWVKRDGARVLRMLSPSRAMR